MGKGWQEDEEKLNKTVVYENRLCSAGTGSVFTDNILNCRYIKSTLISFIGCNCRICTDDILGGMSGKGVVKVLQSILQKGKEDEEALQDRREGSAAPKGSIKDDDRKIRRVLI